MHVPTVSTVFFAALASAYNHGHGSRFHHRRFLNESSPAVTAAPTTTVDSAPLTTLTVKTTVLSTIYNCGQDLNSTTCDGSHATEAITVTETIDLFTTVCPEDDVESIQSSVISSAQTAPVVVEATQTVVPIKSEDLVPTPKPEPEDDTVLTYTLGVGSSQSVVTTTIKNTKTTSEYTVCADFAPFICT